MNKIKIFTLFVICGLSFVICTAMPCFADVKATVSSGGTVQPAFIDLKGEPVIGEQTSGGTKVQLGALYTYGPDIKEQEGLPYGSVPLTIERSGQNISISWPADYPNPQIFVLTGDGTGKFTNSYDGSNWKIYSDGQAFPGEFINDNYANGVLLHKNQVGFVSTHPEVYYKGLQAGIVAGAVNPKASVPGTSFLATANAVGKVDVAIEPGAKLLIASPVVDLMAQNVFQPQLSNGQGLIIYPRLGGGLDVTTIAVTDNKPIFSGNNFNVIPAVGFWMKNTSAVKLTLTFCGGLGGQYTKDLAAKDLTGTPICGQIIPAQLGGENGDIAYKQLGGGLTPYTKSAGKWPNDFSLMMKDGFWFKTNSGTRYWDIDSQNLGAVIKTK